ncbi:hypothetical protein C7B70_00640 [Chlorogloea sp. CCALA 695]|nr:hypothetical protein C7B70_00640 [Chlorogloea sp. CCALA 695]
MPIDPFAGGLGFAPNFWSSLRQTKSRRITGLLRDILQGVWGRQLVPQWGVWGADPPYSVFLIKETTASYKFVRCSFIYLKQKVK